MGTRSILRPLSSWKNALSPFYVAQDGVAQYGVAQYGVVQEGVVQETQRTFAGGSGQHAQRVADHFYKAGQGADPFTIGIPDHTPRLQPDG